MDCSTEKPPAIESRHKRLILCGYERIYEMTSKVEITARNGLFFDLESEGRRFESRWGAPLSLVKSIN
jgi:hypothetical protein